MLGKERNNKWQPDEAFLDRSWENMKAMLDEEMPVVAKGSTTGSNSYLMLALFLLIGFAAGAGSFLYYGVEPEEEAKEIPNASPQIPIAQLDDIPDIPETPVQIEKEVARQQLPQARSDIPTMLRQSRQAMLQSSTDDRPSSHQTPLYDNTPTLNQSIQTLNPLTKQAVIAQTESEQMNAQSLEAQPASHTTLALDQEQGNAVTNRELLTAVPIIASMDAAAIAPLPDHAMGMLVLPKNKARLGLIVAGHYNHLFKTSGYSLGLTAEKRLNPRFILRTGLQYTHFDNIKENQTGAFSNLNLDAADPSNIGGSLEDLEENYTTFRFPNMDYLSVPLTMVYSLSNQLRVNAGVEFSYLLRTRSPGPPEDDRVASEEFLTLDGSAVEKGLRRGNMAASIGVGYYPKENMGLDLSYNFGLLDYTKDDYFGIRQNDTHQFWKLAFSYYFSRK